MQNIESILMDNQIVSNYPLQSGEERKASSGELVNCRRFAGKDGDADSIEDSQMVQAYSLC